MDEYTDGVYQPSRGDLIGSYLAVAFAVLGLSAAVALAVLKLI
jgi:hypothetical protein